MVDMHQSGGDHATNVQVHSQGAASVNVYNGSPGQEKTRLQPAFEEAQHLTLTELRRATRPGWFGAFIMLAALIPASIQILANTLDIADKVGIKGWHAHAWWACVPVFLIGVVLCGLNGKNARRYHRRPATEGGSVYLGDGQFMEKDGGDESWWQYTLAAPCIYSCPGHVCPGYIRVVNAPAREKQRRLRAYVGVCSEWGREHSYRIDGEHIATCCPDMDWREPESSSIQA